jgi:predicted heme/steroid binding protein
MTDQTIITETELRHNNGDNGNMYIAFCGIVYNVTDCPHWRTGLHEGLHFPGQDLTHELEDAPHGEEVFQRPAVIRIGTLAFTEE